MNSLTPEMLKTLRRALFLSLALVLIFIILKIFFYEQKKIQTRTFSNTAAIDSSSEINTSLELKQTSSPLLLLPKK